MGDKSTKTKKRVKFFGIAGSGKSGSLVSGFLKSVKKTDQGLYNKVAWYRKWSENKYSSVVHRSVLTWTALVLFTVLTITAVIPAGNILTPKTAKAGAFSVTWTTKDDFQNNAVTTNTPTTYNQNELVLGDDGTVKLNNIGEAGWEWSADASVQSGAFTGRGVYNVGNSLTYIPLSYSDTVGAIDYVDSSTTPPTSGTLITGSAYLGAEVDTANNKIFGVAPFAQSVDVISGTSKLIERSISFGSYFGNAKYNPSTGKLYVYDDWAGAGYFQVYNAATGAFIKNIDGNNPITLGLNTSRNTIYASSSTDSKQVSIYNGSDDTLLKALTYGSGTTEIVDIVVNTQLDKVFVSYSDGYIKVIDSATNEFVATINAGLPAGTYGYYLYSDVVSAKLYALSYTLTGSENKILIYNATDYTLENTITYSNKYIKPATTFIGDFARNRLIFDTEQNSLLKHNVVKIETFQYAPSGVLTGLKVDVGEKPSWNTISWAGTVPGNTALKFRTRGSDDGVTWPGNWDGPDGLGSNSYYTASGSNITTGSKRYLEIEVTLTSSDGVSTPTLDDFTVAYNTIDAPTVLKQIYNTDTRVDAPTGEFWQTSYGPTVYLTSTVTCLAGSNCHAEYELKKTTESFNGSNVISGAAVAPSQSGSSDTSGSIINTVNASYKWRARVVDDAGRVTPWVNFNNGQTAFKVDVTAPTGGLLIENGAKVTRGPDVHLTVTAADNTGGSGLSALPVRFSNDDSAWTAWEALTPYRLWTLTEGSGTKTVFVQVRDYSGNITDVNTSILTDNVVPIVAFDPNKKYPVTDWNVKENINSTEIRFSTDQATVAYIDYGEAAISAKTEGDPNFRATHDVIIKNLKANTTYKYRLRLIDENDNMGTAPADADTNQNSFFTFTTGMTNVAFEGIPSVSDMSQVEITASTAKITWKTKVPTSSWVDYGTDETLGNTVGDENLSTVHVVELKNLDAGKTYHYRVRGFDSGDNEHASASYTFKAIMKPEIIGISVMNITPSSAEILWDTNVKTDSDVTYGESAANASTVKDTGAYSSHRVTLKDLNDDTLYHYVIEASDEYGNITKSQSMSFRTLLDKVGPTIEEVKIEVIPLETDQSMGQVIISWKSNKPATTKVEYGEGIVGGAYNKTSIEDESLNLNHTVIIKELDPASSYHFRMVSKDKRGNLTTSTDYTVVTPAQEKSIWQLILRSLEQTFAWAINMPKFWTNVFMKVN